MDRRMLLAGVLVSMLAGCAARPDIEFALVTSIFRVMSNRL
jgi:hypothetical protein